MAINEVESQIKIGDVPARVLPKFEVPFEKQDRAILVSRYIFDRCEAMDAPQPVQLSDAGIIHVEKRLVTPAVGPQHENYTVVHDQNGFRIASSLFRVVDAAEALKYDISQEFHAESHPYPDLELGYLPIDVCFVTPVDDEIFDKVFEPLALLQATIDSHLSTV